MAKFKVNQKVTAWCGNRGDYGTIKELWNEREWKGQIIQMYDVTLNDGTTMVGVEEDQIELGI